MNECVLCFVERYLSKTTFGGSDGAPEVLFAPKAFNKVDSQHFLVRQRRNRVYGVAETHCGSTRAEGEFDRMLSGALSSLQTHFHFRMEECFLSDQPQEKIRGGRLQDQINVAMEKARAATWFCLSCFFGRPGHVLSVDTPRIECFPASTLFTLYIYI